MLPPRMSIMRRSPLCTTTRSTGGSLSFALSIAGCASGSVSACTATIVRPRTRLAANVLKDIIFPVALPHTRRIIGREDAAEHVPPSHGPVGGPRRGLKLRRSSPTAGNLLDARHDDLGAGPQVGEVQIRVVLLQQPLRQLAGALGEGPEGVAAAGDVDLGADDAV